MATTALKILHIEKLMHPGIERDSTIMTAEALARGMKHGGGIFMA
jgi:hypothetical protein